MSRLCLRSVGVCQWYEGGEGLLLLHWVLGTVLGGQAHVTSETYLLMK